VRILIFLIFVAQAIAQPKLDFKQIKHNWPWVELTFSGYCGERITAKDSFKVFENGKEILDFEMSCPDSVRCPISVSLVLDISGSMSGSSFDGMIASAREFIRNMQKDDKTAIIVFHHEVFLLQAMTSDTALLLKSLNGLFAIGGTAMLDGAFAGVAQATLGRDCRGVILISDGYSNADIYRIEDVIWYANINQIPIFTIGVGPAVDSTLLQLLAKETGGRYYGVGSTQILSDIYSRILARLNIPDCIIRYKIDCPDGTLRNVELQLSCGKTATKSYVAKLDTSIFKVVSVILRDTLIKGSFSFPLELSDSIKLKNAVFNIWSCGSIGYSGIGSKSLIPGGVQIRIDSAYIKRLGVITVYPPDTDSLCQITVQWETEGCISTLSSQSYIRLIRKRAKVICYTTLKEDTLTLILTNTGDSVKNTRVWDGKKLVYLGDFTGVKTYTWVINDSICVMSLFDNHSTLVCCVAYTRKDTIHDPPKKINVFCSIESSDTVSGVFPIKIKMWTDSGYMWVKGAVLQGNKTIGVGSTYFETGANTEKEIWLQTVSSGWDTIRVIIIGENSVFCETIIFIPEKIEQSGIMCQADSVISIDSVFRVWVTVYGDSARDITLLGSKRFAEKFVRRMAPPGQQFLFEGKPILSGIDTLIFDMGVQCTVIVRITEENPKYELECNLTQSHFSVKITNVGTSTGSDEILIQVSPGVDTDYPLQKFTLFPGRDTTLLWRVRLPQGWSTISVLFQGLSCSKSIYVFTDPIKKSLWCGGPDTVRPGMIPLFAKIDSEWVLLTSPKISMDQWVSDSSVWWVRIDTTTKFIFFSQGLMCEKIVYVIQQKKNTLCEMSVSDSTVTLKLTNIGNTSIWEMVNLILPDSVLINYQPTWMELNPGESVILIWGIEILRSKIDRLLSFYASSCQADIFVKGIVEYFNVTLPSLLVGLGERFPVYITTDRRKKLSMDIFFDTSIITFLYSDGIYSTNGSKISVSGVEPTLYFQAISTDLAKTSLIGANAVMENYEPIYKNGEIWVYGECLAPIEISDQSLIFDILGRRVEKMEKGSYLIWDNGRLLKIRIE
jgi:uncharacterized protein YegL